MNIEHPGAVTLLGRPLTRVGPELKPGDRLPAAVLLAGPVDGELQEVHTTDFLGKIVLISVVESLDTPVCSTQTRRFEEEAAALSPEAQVITVSMDLPFAQKRFCSDAAVDRILVLSDYRDASFGLAFGTLIKELRLHARAVFVADREGVLQHTEYVRELADLPDFDAALNTVKQLLERDG